MQAEPRGVVVLPPLGGPVVASAVLAPPYVPAAAAEAVTLATRAAAGGVPVLLAAPPGAGRSRLARALHAVGGRPGPLLGAAGRRPALHHLPAGATLYVDLAALAPEGLLALEAVLDDAAVWVVAATDPTASVPAPLAGRLGSVVLRVPPLAERPEDLGPLAAAVLAAGGARRGGPAPRLESAALARLAAHAWPGDVTELEAVLGRAVLAAPGDTIGARHLALDPEPVAAPPVAPAAGQPEAVQLELLLAELAHELRNPMVTIKTYADHLPALLEDAELRARFATLAGEAIGRMDGLLDNLLAFARLGPPRPQPIEVAALLRRVLAEVEPELAGRTVRVTETARAAGHCAADPEHVAYALRNLFAGVAREVPVRDELVADASANGVVTLRFAAGGAAYERLRRLVAPNGAADLADPTLLPLAFRLARTVLERNGGDLSVVPGDADTTTLVVRLPTEPERHAH